jgi:hypothetical protein
MILKYLILIILLLVMISGYSQPGHLQITVLDSMGRPTPVRVRLTQKNYAVPVLPDSAVGVMYGADDRADGFGFQPDSAFYVNGIFQLNLPAGDYHLFLSKGLEYLDQQHSIHINAGKTHALRYTMQRWINMPARQWYSTDDHIHIRRSPREDPLLMTWLQAEDIHIGVLLRMGDFWATYFQQYAFGEKGVYKKNDYMITSGQEDPRTPELGHALGLGASDKVRYQNEYYLYDKVFDQLRQLGGLSGYAHQAETFHGYRGLTLDGLRGKVDVLELLQFCADSNPLITEHYYHMLDLGVAITAVAGSDFPWCGNDHDKGNFMRTARIGNVRFYTYMDSAFSWRNWKAALRAGHTFVSSGPVIDLTVNNHLPGDTLDVHKDATINITAHAYGHTSQVPLQKLEIVSHGKVIAQITPNKKEQTKNHLSLQLTLPVQHGQWIAARAYAGPGQAAHTTPVYITMDGTGFHNPNKVPDYLTLSELYLRELEHELGHVNENPGFNLWRYRTELEKRIAEAKKIIEELRLKLK